MKNLYTILLSFSDHLVGVGQHESDNAEEAIASFIETSESLKEYDREIIKNALNPLLHYSSMKGVWGFSFDPQVDTSNGTDNPILGGTIIQSDSGAE